MRHTRATFKTDPLNLLAYTADPAEPFSAADQEMCIRDSLQAAFRPVLESGGHGEAAGHFAMDLALGRARADCGPAQQVGDVLRGDRVEQFRRAGEAFAVDVQQNCPRQLNALGNVAGAVQMGIVDQALPCLLYTSRCV